jgi:hypothetical protein
VSPEVHTSAETIEVTLDVYPHVTPGAYVGLVQHVDVLTMWKRAIVRVSFDLARELGGPLLALNVPFFANVPRPGRRAGGSRLVRLLLLARIEIPRRGPLPLQRLRGRYFTVEVGNVTVSRDHLPGTKTQRPLHPTQIYSVVRAITEPLP